MTESAADDSSRPTASAGTTSSPSRPGHGHCARGGEGRASERLCRRGPSEAAAVRPVRALAPLLEQPRASHHQASRAAVGAASSCWRGSLTPPGRAESSRPNAGSASDPPPRFAARAATAPAAVPLLLASVPLRAAGHRRWRPRLASPRRAPPSTEAAGAARRRLRDPVVVVAGEEPGCRGTGGRRRRWHGDGDS